MHTSIRLTGTYRATDSLILLLDDKSGLPTGLLSADEQAYVQHELKADRNNVVINQYRRLIAVHRLDKKKPEQPYWRRAGVPETRYWARLTVRKRTGCTGRCGRTWGYSPCLGRGHGLG